MSTVPDAIARPTPGNSAARKVAEIMGLLGRVEKRGHNDFHRYDYATEADIMDLVRGKMAERSLVLTPRVVSSQRSPVGEKGEVLTEIFVEYTMLDGDTGDSFSLQVVGSGSDKLDKGAYKALTGAEKYALLKLFLISTGDDPESDGHGHAPTGAGRQAPPAQAKRTEVVRPNAGATPAAPAPGPQPVAAQPKSGPRHAPEPKREDRKVTLEQARTLYKLIAGACGGDLATVRKLLCEETRAGAFAGVEDCREVPLEQYEYLVRFFTPEEVR